MTRMKLGALCLGLLAAWPAAWAEDQECQQIRSHYEQGRQSAGMENQMGCCAARAGQVDEAFARLQKALDKGFRNLKDVAEDEDYKPLHQDPRWAPMLEKLAAAEQRYLQSINLELRELYRTDQADRKQPIDWTVVAPRDEQRRARVLALSEQGLLKAADDYYHAAMVMQHGAKPDDYARAMRWAHQAWVLDPNHQTARWLSAAAEDRYLQALGKPQVWGTQFGKRSDKEPWTLEPFDRQAKTDTERQAMNVPTLAEALKRVESMNARDAR